VDERWEEGSTAVEKTTKEEGHPSHLSKQGVTKPRQRRRKWESRGRGRRKIKRTGSRGKEKTG